MTYCIHSLTVILPFTTCSDLGLFEFLFHLSKVAVFPLTYCFAIDLVNYFIPCFLHSDYSVISHLGHGSYLTVPGTHVNLYAMAQDIILLTIWLATIVI